MSLATTVARHRTAIARPDLSRPIRLALEDGLISTGATIFDYGCGLGDDVRQLRGRGFECSGWDPVHRPKEPLQRADVVNLGYVVNVIENPSERVEALKRAWDLSERALVVSARLTLEQANGHSVYGDGYLTTRGTFQKYYDQHELRSWIDDSLGTPSLAAAPGIFYVFRDPGLRESFAASRYRRRFAAPRIRKSDLLYEEHKEILAPLVEFVGSRGRLPDETELSVVRQICQTLGSLRRAFGVIRHATDDTEWDRVREERAQDLLLYLALVRFDRRPKYSELPRDLSLDVRAFFSSYKNACGQADRLLFSAGKLDVVDRAARESPVGKLAGDSLYVHKSSLSQLPAVLRVYEGCARAYVGEVEAANVVKLSCREPKVSYLSYPDFDSDPHPALFGSLVVPLQTFRLRYHSYNDRENPPVLHRKETIVAADYPGREKFARLTRQEEKAGLFSDPRHIGTRQGWNEFLAIRGYKLAGHRLVKV